MFLDKFTGLAVSHGVIHRWAREEGERLLARDESQRTAVFMHRVPLPETAASRPLVYVQVDGTGVHERGQPGSMKCKVGVVSSERAEISAGRVALLD